MLRAVSAGKPSRPSTRSAAWRIASLVLSVGATRADRCGRALGGARRLTRLSNACFIQAFNLRRLSRAVRARRRHRRELRPDGARSTVVDVSEVRREKDRFFGGPHDSPLTVEQRRSFTGLKYFDSDPSFRFEVALEGPAGGVEEVEMSDGTTDHLQRAGTVKFAIDG